MTAIDRNTSLLDMTSGARDRRGPFLHDGALETTSDRHGDRDARDRVRVDLREWPLVVLRWPGGIRSDHEVAEAMSALRALSLRYEPHVVLLEAVDARPPTPTQLGMILDCAREAAPRTRCLAMATVTRSAAARAIIDSVRWVMLTQSRWAHFESVALARTWLASQSPGALAHLGPIEATRAQRFVPRSVE